MRAVGGVALWVVATLIGLSAAGWFSLSGLGWSNLMAGDRATGYPSRDGGSAARLDIR